MPMYISLTMYGVSLIVAMILVWRMKKRSRYYWTLLHALYPTIFYCIGFYFDANNHINSLGEAYGAVTPFLYVLVMHILLLYVPLLYLGGLITLVIVAGIKHRKTIKEHKKGDTTL